MTPAARLSAAIELIDTIDAQRVPAAKALKEWGTAHRYAGSGDRAAISGLIWDVLRRRASSAWIMDEDTPRARVLGMLKLERGMDAEAIAALCDGGRFAPEPLSDGERAALTSRSLDDAPAHIAGDYPEWLDRLSGAGVRRRPRRGGDRDGEPRAARSARQHPEGQAREGAGLDSRISAPSRRRGRRSACASSSAPTPAIPASMPRRISSRAPSRCRTRARNWRRLLSAAKPGEQVIDLCAGAGGKTLALAAMMQGKGRLIATDHDKRQLAPIYERLSRAGVHNADVRTPKGDGRHAGRYPRPPPIWC